MNSREFHRFLHIAVANTCAVSGRNEGIGNRRAEKRTDLAEGRGMGSRRAGDRRDLIDAVVRHPWRRRPVPLTATPGEVGATSMAARFNPSVLQDAASSVPAATML